MIINKKYIYDDRYEERFPADNVYEDHVNEDVPCICCSNLISKCDQHESGLCVECYESKRVNNVL